MVLKSREQQLIDICFACAIVSTEFNQTKSNEEIANWVRHQLRECGFNVSGPVGMSWGILQPNAPKADNDNFEIVEAGRPDV
jgi:hypothetical protein